MSSVSHVINFSIVDVIPVGTLLFIIYQKFLKLNNGSLGENNVLNFVPLGYGMSDRKASTTIVDKIKLLLLEAQNSYIMCTTVHNIAIHEETMPAECSHKVPKRFTWFFVEHQELKT